METACFAFNEKGFFGAWKALQGFFAKKCGEKRAFEVLDAGQPGEGF